MHDESPSGQATADRALAYWTDPNNFARERSVDSKANGFVARWRAIVWHYIDGIDIFLNGVKRG